MLLLNNVSFFTKIVLYRIVLIVLYRDFLIKLFFALKSFVARPCNFLWLIPTEFLVSSDKSVLFKEFDIFTTINIRLIKIN